jgi:hypothetical protein
MRVDGLELFERCLLPQTETMDNMNAVTKKILEMWIMICKLLSPF